MSLTVLARKTKTIKSKNRSSDASTKKTNTSQVGYNNYLSRKNNSANRPSGLTCCGNNNVKVIVKTNDVKYASDKINKQKVNTISCNNEVISASSSHIERVKSSVKACIDEYYSLIDGPATTSGTLRWALLNWWPTEERPIKGILFIKKAKYAKYGPIERWNTQKVTDFSNLISYVEEEMKLLGMKPLLSPRDFNEYIGNWNTSNVIDMSYMFRGLTTSDADVKPHKFNQDITRWDVSNVKNMEGMFSELVNPETGVFDFNQDIGRWDVSNVENMSKMFSGAVNFTKNLKDWATNGYYGIKSNVDTENMFGYQEARSKLKIREKYSLLPTNPSTIRDIWVRYWSEPLYDDNINGLTISDAVEAWFDDPNSFSSGGIYSDYSTIENWDVSNVEDMKELFSGRDMENIDIRDWDVGKVTDMSGTFKNTKNLDISTLHELSISADVPVVGMFDGAKGIPDQYSDVIQPDNGTPDVSKLFKKNKAIVNGDSNSVDKLGIYAAVDLWMNDSTVFNKLGKYGDYGSIKKWNTILVTDMSGLFKDKDSFNENISEWDVSDVKDFRNMFEGAKKFYVDLRKWDVGKVEKMSETFKGADMIYKKLYDNDNEPKPNIESDGTTNKDDWRKLKWPVTILKDGPKERVGSLRWALHEWSTDKSLFNTRGDYEDYGTIEEWNTSIITDMSGLFKDKDSFNEDISEWDVGEVKYMSSMFEGAADFNQDISGWNVSEVKDMSSMFEGASAFNQDIGGWNVSSVENMTSMFKNANGFDKDIGGWNVRNVENMSSMFKNASDFNKDISNWERDALDGSPASTLANVTNMTSMFEGATTFNQDNGGWNVSKVDNMTSMFEGATAFDKDIGGWNVGNVENMSSMFKNASDFNKDISNWERDALDGSPASTLANVKDMSSMFKNAKQFNNAGSGGIDGWNVSNVITMASMFEDASEFNQPVNEWNVSKVENMEKMFMFANNFNRNLYDWNVGNVTNMNSMFYMESNSSLFVRLHNNNISSNGREIISVDGTPFAAGNETPINRVDKWKKLYWSLIIPLTDGEDTMKGSLKWAVKEWFTNEAYFNMASEKSHGAIDYRDYGTIEEWNTKDITDMSELFKDNKDFNKNISNWDVSNVTTMARMFEGDESFNQNISNWERAALDGSPASTLANVKDMSSMFKNAKQFNNAGSGGIDGWNVSNVITMASMFEGASAFNQNISNWERGKYDDGITVKLASTLGNVTDMSGMFKNATQFNNGGSEGIDGWDVSNVETMKSMFEGAVNFNQGVNPGWNTESLKNTERMFFNAKSFNKPLNKWTVSNVTSMKNMFGGASNFNQPLHKWERRRVVDPQGRVVQQASTLANVENMSSMFSGAKMFDQDITTWNVSNVNTMERMFSDAPMFDQDISRWDVREVLNMRKMFAIENAGKAGSFNQNLSHWGSDTFDKNVDYTSIFSSNGTHNHKLVTDHFAEDDLQLEGSPAKLWHEINWPVKKLTDGESGVVGSLRWAVKKWFESADPESKFRPFETLGKYREYGSIERWDTKDIINMADLFKDKDSFNENISDWNTGNVETMSGMFQNAIMFNKDISKWNVSNVKDMKSMFLGAKKFDQDISDWERIKNIPLLSNLKLLAKSTSTLANVKDMSSMFKNAKQFNNGDQIGIYIWNVSNVKDMSGMFKDASYFNQDISAWNVSNVGNMSSMFENASLFDKSIGNWERAALDGALASTLANVKDMSSMFKNAKQFNNSGSGGIDRWNVSNVKDMSSMFKDAVSFNKPVNAWNVENVTNMSGMFNGASIFNQPLNAWNVKKVENMSETFKDAASFNQDISRWNVSKVKYMIKMFAIENADKPASFNQNLSHWGSETFDNNVDYSAIFLSDETNKHPVLSYFKDGDLYKQPDSSSHSNPGRPHGTPAKLWHELNWPVKKLINGVDSQEGSLRWAVKKWFESEEDEDESKVRSFATLGAYREYGSIENWDTGDITDMSQLFFVRESFNKDISKWNTGKVENMSFIFWGAKKFNQDISKWNVSKVTDMTGMFAAAKLFNKDISNWERKPKTDTDDNIVEPASTLGNVEKMGGMFFRATSFNNGDKSLNMWNTEALSNVNRMFMGAESFNQDISDWNVSKVKDMSELFKNAESFNQDISNWEREPKTDTDDNIVEPASTLRNVTHMTEMFMGASDFNKPVNNWNTENVEDMSMLFYRAQFFNQPIDKWNVSRVKNMSDMFGFAVNFNQDISNWEREPKTDTDDNIVEPASTLINVENMSGMFLSAFKFNQDISSWDVSNVENMASMFEGFNYNEFRNLLSPPTENEDASSATALRRKLFMKRLLNYTEYALFEEYWENTKGSSSPPAFVFLKFAKLLLNSTVFNIYNDAYEKERTIGSSESKSISEGETAVDNHFLNEKETSHPLAYDYGLIFNQNISKWNVSKVKNMEKMFMYANNFNRNLYDWDVGNVTNMNSMFYMRYNSSLFVRLSNNGDSSNKERQIISASGTPFGYTPGISVDKWKKLYWSLIIPLTDGASGTIGSLKWAVNEWFTNKDSFNMDYKNPDGTIGGYRDYGTIEEWNTSIITDMSGLFKDKDSFNQNISNWDVSNVTTMARMFEGAESFNQNIRNWEREQQFGTIIKPATTLAKVENMSHMFKDAKAFNQNIGNWNTENVNNMSHMFDGAFVFNKSINSWTVSNVITMASMFKDAKAFNQNIGTWNTENVDNMSHMFDGALVFNKSINSWSVNNVKTTEYMFSNAQEFNNGSASLNTWQFNSNTNYEGMFKDARLFNQPINSWLNSAPNNIENDDKISFKDMFKDALVFNQNLTDWVVENVKDMSGMFYRAMSFNNGLRGPPEGLKETDPVGNIKGWIYEGYDENNKSNKIPISKWKWNVQNVKTMSYMFYNAWAFNQTLSHWNYGNSLKDISYMFYNAITFNNGYEYGVMNPPRHPDVGDANFDGSKFATAEIITQDDKDEEISGNGSGYLFAGWFESVENASHMFNQAYSFNSNIFYAYLKLGVITNLDYMFANAISFETGFLEGYFADEPREATDEPTGFISAVLDLRIEVGTPDYEKRLRDGFPTYKNILLFSTGFTMNTVNPSRAFIPSTVVFTPKEITDQTNLIDASAKTAGI